MKHDSHRPHDDRSALHAMVGRRVRTGLVLAAVLGALSLVGCGTVASAAPVIPGSSMHSDDARPSLSLGTDGAGGTGTAVTVP